MNNWTKLRQLTLAELKLLISAIFFLPFVNLLLHSFGYLRLYQGIEKLIPVKQAGGNQTRSELIQTAKNIARLVSIAANHGIYRATCLRKSLMVWGLLRRQGLESQICFGVRLVEGVLEAHAWVEWQGSVINDQLDVRERYAPLSNGFPQTQVGL